MYKNTQNHNGSYNNEMQMSTKSNIRILHASPNAPPVDIYANGDMIVENIAYKQLTNYILVLPDNYNIQVFPSGQTTNPVINTKITVPSKSSITIAAVGNLSNISLLPIVEDYIPKLDVRKSYVKFAHLSPDAPAVDITLIDGTMLFSDINYKEYSEYITVDPGNYTLQVRPSGKNQVVLAINVNLMSDNIYTVYAVGLVAGNPPLEAIMSIDGEIK